jgi:thiol-disulfide isomerase/thioredoxin
MPRISSVRAVSRLTPCVAGCLAVALCPATVPAAAPSVAEALKLEPRQQGVDFERPTAEEAAAATIKQEKLDGVSALVVRAADGRILRAFADVNGDRVVDRWSYFKDGLEYYRELDGDDADAKADQSRWLNAGGTRWGVDRDGDGVLDAWQAISAEEATAEIVNALGRRDAAAFVRLLPTKADLEAAGFSGDRLTELTSRADTARQAFAKLAAEQKKVGASAVWTSMLTPQPPGVLPAGSPGVERDVTAYDNVVALADDAGTGVQVIVGSLVRCGDAWRPVDAPQLPGADGRLSETLGFFMPASAGGAAGSVPTGGDEALRPLMASLRELEDKMVKADAAGRAKLADAYIAKLEEIAAAAAPGEQPFWRRQLVETVAAYVQEGNMPDGLATLERLATRFADDEALAAFVDFRLIQARYAASMEAGDADADKLQVAWFDNLAAFVEKHPKAAEAAEAMLQLAFRDEFEGRDAEAIARYGEIAAGFPDTPQARKAAGAARRLESVGKPLGLTGKTLDGKQVSIEALKGRPVLVHFWSTDCEPCKVDLAQIRELNAKYGQRIGCIGVAVDGDRAKLAAFLADKPLPWPQLHEDGGLDSRLAEEFGILALPTMMLVAADGTVADRNVSITDLEKKLAALLGGKP